MWSDFKRHYGGESEMKHAARSSSAIGIRGSQGGSTNASRTAGPSGPATSSWAVLNRPATAHASDVLAGGGRHLLQQPTSGGSSRQASAGGPRPRSVSGRQRDSSTQSQDKGPGTSAGYVRIQPGPASEGGAAQSIRKLSTRERAMREMSSRRRRYERSQKKAAEADLVQETEDTSSAWRTRPGSSPTLVRCKPSGNRTEASPSASAEPVRHAISSVYIASTNKEHLRGWDDLPDEIMERVVETISSFPEPQVTASSVRMVCKRWGEQLASMWTDLTPAKMPRGKDKWVGSWSGIKRLDLAQLSGQIGDSKVAEISRLSRLETLRLPGNPKLTDKSFVALRKLPGLTFIDISHCEGIVGAGSSLRQLTAVRTLKLDGCSQVSDETMEELTYIPDLENLSLRNCYMVSDMGLEILAMRSSLAFLALDGCQVTSVGLSSLSQLGNLKYISLKGCRQMDGMGLGAIPSLQTVILTGCSWVTDDSLQPLAILPSVTHLELSECTQITDTGLHALRRMAQLRHLDLSLCEKLTDNGVLTVHNLKNLTSLNLSGCPQIGDTGLAALRYIPSLSWLALDGSNVTAQGLENVCPGTWESSPSPLRHLSLSRCLKLPENAVSRLCRHTSLTSLDISDCTGVCDSSLMPLQMLTAMRELSLAWCSCITDAGIAAILPGLQQLVSLNLEGCRMLTDSSLAVIGSNAPDIEDLTLDGLVCVTDDGLAALSPLQHLKSLRLAWCRLVSNAGVAWLQQLRMLACLDVSACWRLTDEAIGLLRTFPRLKKINVSHTQLTAAGMARLHKAGMAVIHSDGGV